MKLKLYYLLLPIFGINLLINYLLLINVNSIILTIFSSFYILIMPGFLLLLLFKSLKLNFWELFSIVIGLSIFLITIFGLLINQILPYFSIYDPLSKNNFIISFLILQFIIFCVGLFLHRTTSVSLTLKGFTLNNLLIFLPSFFILVYAVVGALTLNQNQGNLLSIYCVVLIIIYVLVLNIFFKKIDKLFIPFFVFITSISLLILFSLRSSHIIGYDINHEYRVFISTLQNNYWDMAKSKWDTYNACLSITILPTILKNYINIPSEYIYKLVFQIIFSFTPVILYSIFKKYFNEYFAFLGSLFFMFQIQFIYQMPALARQEIAFLFFSLLIFVLFNDNLKKYQRDVLFVIFSLGLIVSHYSTTYVALALLSTAYIFNKLAWLILMIPPLKSVLQKLFNTDVSHNLIKNYLSLPLLVIFIFSALLWNTVLTQSSKNIYEVGLKTIQNTHKIFNNDLRSDAVGNILIRQTNLYTINDINSYIQKTKEKYKSYKRGITWFDKNDIKNFSISPTYPIFHKPMIIGGINIGFYYQLVVGFIIKFAPIIGVIYISYRLVKKKNIDSEYVFLNWGGLILIISLIVLPYVSIGYNFERLYQQILITMSMLVIVGIAIILPFKQHYLKNLFITFILLSYFILPTGSGISSEVLGGPVSILFNNKGEDYDRFYVHDTEIESLQWLDNYNNGYNRIYIDRYSSLRLASFTNIKPERVLNDIVPDILDKNGYIYASYTNTIAGRSFSIYNSSPISYSFSNKFLDINKNLIYNNGGSKIYK